MVRHRYLPIVLSVVMMYQYFNCIILLSPLAIIIDLEVARRWGESENVQ